MRVSALERVLESERVRHRSTLGEFAHPVLHERGVTPEEAPFLVSNKRGSFVQTRRRPDGTIWAGFSEVPVGEEGDFIRELHGVLWKASEANGWTNRCSSLAEAGPLMQSLGFEPRTLVVPVDLLKEACGEVLTAEDAERLMLTRGQIAKVGNLIVLGADLAAGTAILAADPKMVGTYTRTDDALAVMLTKADRAVVLVGPGGVA